MYIIVSVNTIGHKMCNLSSHALVDLRNKLRVTLVNAQGLDEPGIDGGGVFREFLNELLKTGFDPNRGYFTTTQDGQLYPNPQVKRMTSGILHDIEMLMYQIDARC